MRRLTLSALVAVSVLGGGDPVTAQYTLDLAPVGAPVLAVVDPQRADGRPANPFREECIARLAVVDADGQVQLIQDDEELRSSLRLYPAGRRGMAMTPGWMNITDAGLIEVLLAPQSSNTEYQVLLGPVTVTSGDSDTTVDELVSVPFSIPETEVVRCGAVPRVNFDIQQPTGGTPGLALDIDVVQRGAISSGRGGFWEVFAEGFPATADTLALLDSWKAGGRFEVKLTESYTRWISVGGVFRFETSEDLEVVDKVLGASLRLRLDFLGLDALLTPLLEGYAPYPMVVFEYNNVMRDTDVPANVVLGPAIDHRLKGRLDWSVPLLFETTLRLKLQGDLLLGGLPPGVDDRWRDVADVSLEYPLNATGDVTAVLTRVAGETAPLYQEVSRYLLGIGIRR